MEPKIKARVRVIDPASEYYREEGIVVDFQRNFYAVTANSLVRRTPFDVALEAELKNTFVEADPNTEFDWSEEAEAVEEEPTVHGSVIVSFQQHAFQRNQLEVLDADAKPLA